MNGAELMVSSMAAILSPTIAPNSVTEGVVAATAEPLVSREQALLETFFHGLSHFAHEKAKEIVDREREVVKAQLSAELASVTPSPSKRGGSPVKTSSGASRATSPVQQQGSNWLSFLNSLSLLTNVEKDYWNLVFVGGSQASSGLALSIQTLFSRRKESSLKGDCGAVLNELKKIEVIVSPDEESPAAATAAAAAAATSNDASASNVDGFPSEKLLSHLSEQLRAFVTARMRLIEFYEQMHALSTSALSSNSSSSPARMDKIGGSVAGDLIIVLTDIIQTYQKDFHHPILSPLKTTFSTECGILLCLFQAQVEILRCSFLTSLLNLNDAHRKLHDWDAIITFQAKKGNFAPRGITIGGAVGKKAGSNIGDPMPLYAWLWKFRASLISKFTFYFYEVLSRQSPNAGEMKSLTAKTDFDFLGKVTTFVKKTDAFSVSLVYDSTSLSPGAAGNNGSNHIGGFGYRHPESLTGVSNDALTSTSSSSGSSPSSPSSPPPAASGIKTYPVVFSFPSESDRHLAQCEQNHWAIVVSLIHHYAFGKSGEMTAHIAFAGGGDAAAAAKLSGGGSGGASNPGCPRVLSLFDRTINTTYLVTNVEPNYYLVLLFEGKKSEKDSYVAGFLEEIASALQLSHVFRLLRPGAK